MWHSFAFHMTLTSWSYGRHIVSESKYHAGRTAVGNVFAKGNKRNAIEKDDQFCYGPGAGHDDGVSGNHGRKDKHIEIRFALFRQDTSATGRDDAMLLQSRRNSRTGTARAFREFGPAHPLS